MEVTVLRSTDAPERLVCQAARGDYFDGYVGDTEYAELMKNVKFDDRDVEGGVRSDGELRSYDDPNIVETKTKSFIEKQLSRGHYGPWEHPQITFSVEGVSRVTMAQITRHRHLTFDVQSQRYVDFSDKEAIVPKGLRDPDHFARETGEVDMDENELEYWRNAYRQMTREQFRYYNDMVNAGIPKEDARYILPVGTPVNMTFSGNARAMMHVLNLRQKANAQWEIRELSNGVAEMLEEWMPYTGAWWRENGPLRLSP